MKVILVLLFWILIVLVSSCSSPSEDHSVIINRFESGEFFGPDFTSSLLYRLYIPEQLGDVGKVPLVLYLHGGGVRGNDNVAQIEFGARTLVEFSLQSGRPFFVLAPQCPKGTQWLNTKCDNIPLQNYSQASIPESQELKMVIGLIRQLVREYPVDPGRIYVTGISMGGSGTWDIIARYPEMFAAAVPLNGVSDPASAPRIAHIPIWAFHGRTDPISDVNNTRKMVSALRQNGGSCEYTEYADFSHDIDGVTYRNSGLWDWLFVQSKNKIQKKVHLREE